jgi:DNA-binding HxlR family transcriptional regulator
MKVSPQVSALTSLAELYPDGVFPANCPSRLLLNHVTSTWGVLILAALTGGSLRWSELRRSVQGVSEKMLAQTLRTLEADGLVHREARPVIPPHVDYRLTELGEELTRHLVPLLQWIGQHAEQITARPSASQSHS